MDTENLMSNVSDVWEEGSEAGTPGKVVPPAREKTGE
jgi:hypothetical protein